MIFHIFLNLDFVHSKKNVLLVDTNTNQIRKYSYDKTLHKKLAIIARS